MLAVKPWRRYLATVSCLLSLKWGEERLAWCPTHRTKWGVNVNCCTCTSLGLVLFPEALSKQDSPQKGLGVWLLSSSPRLALAVFHQIMLQQSSTNTICHNVDEGDSRLLGESFLHVYSFKFWVGGGVGVDKALFISPSKVSAKR